MAFYSGFSHWQRWFSIVFCMFTRGYMIWLCVQPCKINCPWLHPKPSPTGIAMLQSSWSQHQLWNKTKGPSYYRVTRPGKRLHNWWERSTVVNGKIHYKWSFSIAMLNYQRVQATCHAKFQAYLEKNHLPSLCQSFFLENGYHSGHEWDLCNLVIPEKPKDPIDPPNLNTSNPGSSRFRERTSTTNQGRSHRLPHVCTKKWCTANLGLIA